jgi:hypothetical protein
MVELNVNMGKAGKTGSRKIRLFVDTLPQNIRKGLGQAGAVVAREAKLVHQAGRPAPQIRTGTLLRSINFQLQDNGQTVVIGPGGLAAAYAAALEFGHPRWPSGTKYPFMGPAWERSGDKAIDKFQDTIARPLDR